MAKNSQQQESERPPVSPVSRKTNYTEVERSFFLSCINGDALEKLIEEAPWELKTYSGKKVRGLIYLHRPPLCTSDTDIKGGLTNAEAWRVYLNREDARSGNPFFGGPSRSLAAYISSFPGDKYFSIVENCIKQWMAIHKERLIKSLDRTTGRLRDAGDLIERYGKYIITEQDSDYALRLRLVNSDDPPTLLEYFEVNYLLRPLVDTDEKLFTSLRLCSVCGRLYFAGCNNSIYCSSSCRGKEFRKRKSLATK